MAPDAKVLPAKVLDSEGSGSDRDVARDICFAADHGAKVAGPDPAYGYGRVNALRAVIQ